MNSKYNFLTIILIFKILTLEVNGNGFECPDKFGHYPDSSDCSKYYVCDHGRGLEQQCDEGLYYNTFLKTCDWPRNVPCDRGGKRVNTRRNPDLKKTSHKKENSNLEERNELNANNGLHLDYNHNYNKKFQNNHQNDILLDSPPVPNHIQYTTDDSEPTKRQFPKWQKDLTFPKSVNRTDGQLVPNNVNDSPLEDNPNNYEYEALDYYDYEEDKPIYRRRQPLKEDDEKTVRRIGWLPGDKDSDDMNQYHWSPEDAVSYSKDKPKIPEEAFIRLKDFRNVDKQLAEDNSPNEGPPPHDIDDYDDYYEEHHLDDIEHHKEGDEHQSKHPILNHDDKVQYDDEEEVRFDPKIKHSMDSRSHKREQVSTPSSNRYVNPEHKGPKPFHPTLNQRIDSRRADNKLSAPKPTITSSSAQSLSNSKSVKPEINNKNTNTSYLSPVIKRNDRKYKSKKILIKSIPKNVKKRIVVKKVVKDNNEPKLTPESSEAVIPSVYRLVKNNEEISNTFISYKPKAQEFRDSIINNYMNNNKQNYVLNYKEFDQKLNTVPIAHELGDIDGDNYRDFDKDFGQMNEQKNKLKIYKNIINFNKNRTNDRNDNYFNGNNDSLFNTNAILKQQRVKNWNSIAVTTVLPPVKNKKTTEKPTINGNQLNDYNIKPSLKRSSEGFYGFKEAFIISTPTPVSPTTDWTTSTTRVRIKTPKMITTSKPKVKKTSEWYKHINYEPKSSEGYVKAQTCHRTYCSLPDCRCGGTDIPGGLYQKQTPQIILLTFDDSINDLNWEIYEEIFNSGRVNPNGCPIVSTFYVSHEWTDYAQVQTLYSRGHEMASHSITHSFGEKFSKELWFKEISGQRELLRLYAGVNEEDVRGMRAPFLQTGGNTMFEMLYEANFTYDSSLPVYDINPPFFPYTLDYAIGHECMITPCPTKSFPGLWEVGMVMWEDMRGGRCSMADACFNPRDEEEVYQMVRKNFERHYTTNRAPFGIYLHSRWFLTDHNRKGFIKFLDQINGLNDVYFVTNWQMIEWMKDPQPLSKIKQFIPWKCDYSNRPPECQQPNECKAKLKGETRVFKTCQACPKTYPWRGNNGLTN